MVNKDYEVPIKFVLAGISNMTGATGRLFYYFLHTDNLKIL